MAPPLPSCAVVPVVVDVNAASGAQLQALPGLGPSRAEALVLERIRSGPFTGLEDLERVHGFGPAMRRSLEPFVRF